MWSSQAAMAKAREFLSRWPRIRDAETLSVVVDA